MKWNKGGNLFLSALNWNINLIDRHNKFNKSKFGKPTLYMTAQKLSFSQTSNTKNQVWIYVFLVWICRAQKPFVQIFILYTVLRYTKKFDAFSELCRSVWNYPLVKFKAEKRPSLSKFYCCKMIFCSVCIYHSSHLENCKQCFGQFTNSYSLFRASVWSRGDQH